MKVTQTHRQTQENRVDKIIFVFLILRGTKKKTGKQWLIYMDPLFTCMLLTESKKITANMCLLNTTFKRGIRKDLKYYSYDYRRGLKIGQGPPCDRHKLFLMYLCKKRAIHLYENSQSAFD